MHLRTNLSWQMAYLKGWALTAKTASLSFLTSGIQPWGGPGIGPFFLLSPCSTCLLSTESFSLRVSGVDG